MHQADLGSALTIDVVGDRYTFLATTDTTGGAYALWHAIVTPGGGPPPHTHRRENEAFFVLEGTLTFFADGERLVRGPGSFVSLPQGSEHHFRNETDQPARMLIHVAPAGLEKMFLQAGRRVTDLAAPILPPTKDDIGRLLAIAPSFGVEIKVSH